MFLGANQGIHDVCKQEFYRMKVVAKDSHNLKELKQVTHPWSGIPWPNTSHDLPQFNKNHTKIYNNCDQIACFCLSL